VPVAKQFGRTEPRLWTKPLRELTPETSLGFQVIAFATEVLGVTLYPWQRWLLIHALELLEDGTYRFKRIIVLVARQQGKTMLASVLAAWWLFVDSKRHPERVPPLKFKVVGVAQNLDIAKEPWQVVKTWCDPKPETEEDGELAIASLQGRTAKVIDTNGALSIVARTRAHYEIRAAKNARGKPAARVLMDEMREQKDWSAWNAVSQTTKSFFNGMLIGFSNAGDAGAVVLKTQRTAGIEDIENWDSYVEAGLMSAEEYANTHDVSLGLFEWSAPDGCAKDDVEGILQANPSIGHGVMTVQSALADIRGMTDAGYRTEVLCQWVTSRVDSYIDVKDWRPRRVLPSEIIIARGSRTVWALDTSEDDMTWLAAAVLTTDGRPFVTTRVKRTGMLWVPKFMVELAEKSGHREVVVQSRGCRAAEFAPLLEEAGLIVHALDGGQFAHATARMRDRVRDRQLLIIEQPDIDTAVEGGVVMDYADNKAWSRRRSKPVDISGLIAESEALYGLEMLTPPPPKQTAPPPPAPRVIRATSTESREPSLRTIQF
jgi:phage terminase large subunit-like protein